ncbi:NUDIX hydrolase [Candidatus Berkelbacteria bacterium]|nr:NUDIX hydrolase [Candidatus Berkelbacteria bacterium]
MDKIRGAKAFLLYNDKILTVLRDNNPEINFPDMWDIPGGRREEGETPFECLEREVMEEVNVKIFERDVIWQLEVISDVNPGKTTQLYALNLTDQQVKEIKLGNEGQCWKFMEINDYLSHPKVISHHKIRLRAFLKFNQAKTD